MSWFAIKLQLNGTSPVLSVALRFGLASALLFAYCLWQKKNLRFNSRAHARMALLGVALYAVPFTLLYSASQSLPSGMVALLFSSTLLFNLLLGSLFLRTEVTAYKIVTCFVGIGGLALLVLSQVGHDSLGDQGEIAAMLAIMGAFIGSVGAIVSARNRAVGIQIVEGNTFAMGYASLLLLAICVLREEHLSINLTPSFIGAWLYLSVFASVLGFGLYLKLVQQVGPDQAGYATVLFPVVSLSISALAENVQWNQVALAGIMLVFLGNLLLVRSQPASGTTVTSGANR
jgi:drug/metabolite transporter (DMT)-like permease